MIFFICIAIFLISAGFSIYPSSSTVREEEEDYDVHLMDAELKKERTSQLSEVNRSLACDFQLPGPLHVSPCRMGQSQREGSGRLGVNDNRAGGRALTQSSRRLKGQN